MVEKKEAAPPSLQGSQSTFEAVQQALWFEEQIG